jgi:4-hydroxy-tetrahydrodipicolinate synthase
MREMTLPAGLWVALPTPFDAIGAVDIAALRAVVAHVLRGGVDVLVPLGTTGEAATLEDGERDAVIAACREAAPGVTLVVGCGSPATARAIAYAQRARALGADGALVVTPYYNKPTQEGLLAHYRALADALPGFPVAAYNVPSRTGVSLALPTLQALWQTDTVVALKDSSGEVGRFRDIARTLPADKILLCGDDHLAVQAIAAGARGLVSVIGNVRPAATASMVRAAISGDGGRAQTLLQRLLPLAHALFLESNPIPLKAALDLLGVCGPHVRLPLTPAKATTIAALRDALARSDAPAGTTS